MSRICNDMTRLILGGAVIFGASQVYEDNLPLDHPAIQYRHEPADDPVARLARELERGNSTLDFEAGLSYLPSLLDRLRVRPDSQTLAHRALWLLGSVFSRQLAATSSASAPKAKAGVYR